MDVTIDRTTAEVVKRATTPDERGRLAREERALRALAHPGVARLLRSEGGERPSSLTTELAAGEVLSKRGGATEAAVARWGECLATTLADLHDLGWVHGSVRAEHAVLDASGRPVLVSLGQAVATSECQDWERRRAGDVADLVRLLSDLLPLDQSGRLHRLLSRAPGGRRSDARVLARSLSSFETPGPSSPRRGPYLLAGALAAAGLAAVVGPVLHPSSRPAPCPPVDQGCTAIRWPTGTALRLVAPAGSVVVIGRWQCSPRALPAVLNPRTGAVWVFDGWPGAGHPRPARLVAQVPGAVSVAVRAGSSGCDSVVALTSAGRRVVVDPVRRR